MYYESGLCGFLKGNEAVINKRASLAQELKFLYWQDERKPKELMTGKIRLTLAKLYKWEVTFFPDIESIKTTYRNS
jgi:hypothetical protein